MESEIIEAVLKEILEDLKQTYDLSKENNLLSTENKNRIIGIEKILSDKNILKPIMDTQPIERIISQGLDNISTRIDQPKNKRRPEFRFLFFPEHNTREYYKVVYGRIIFWLVMLVIAKYLYFLGSEWISKNYDDLKYKKAWENLYQQQGKANQKIMESIIHLDIK